VVGNLPGRTPGEVWCSLRRRLAAGILGVFQANPCPTLDFDDFINLRLITSRSVFNKPKMIATHRVSKLVAVLMAMAIGISLNFGRLPKIGTKNLEEQLEGCFKAALRVSIIKIALFDQEKMTEQDKFEIDYKGIMFPKPGVALPNRPLFQEFYSYDQLFIEFLIKFKLAENPTYKAEQEVKDNAKIMADWLLSRYKTHPYFNKCHALSGAIHAVLLYLEKEDLTIKENGERWEINGHDKDYNIVRSLFLASLLKGVMIPGFYTYHLFSNPQKDDLSISFCKWSSKNKKCEINSDMIWKKFNQYKYLLSLSKDYEKEEQFHLYISNWLPRIEKSQLVKDVDRNTCSSFELSQAILAHRFFATFLDVSVDLQLVFESILQRSGTEAGREDKIDRVVLVASDMEIASPLLKLRRVTMKAMFVQIIYEHFRNGPFFTGNKYRVAQELIDSFKGKKISKEVVMMLAGENKINMGEGIKVLLDEIGLGTSG
jgi:hypothetical protein